MPADLSTGADAIGGERFGDCEYNDIKNHWRANYGGDPCGSAGLEGIVPGMIVSDEYDDRLYHAILDSACDCSEILQSCVPLSDDKALGFGNDWNAQAGYDELTNDALILGIPVDPERGVIVCDIADIGVDFTGLITASAYPVFWFVDLDNDSYLGVGHQADDKPGIWSGGAVHIQYDANGNAVFFEGSGAGENEYVYIYGWSTGRGAAQFTRFQMSDTNDEFLIEAENNADHEGITVALPEEYQKFRIRGTGGTLFFDFEPNNANGPYGTIPDVDGDSLLEFGWFADDIGLLTIPANPLRENMLTNSGFGVWSQSDTNKGLATLVYDNLAGGNFGVGDTITGATSGATGKLITDNGTTTMTLGAVSGTFQDNEQIGNGAGVTADVNGDAAIGVKNDPMNNDSTGLWTDDGVNITLAFAAVEYTVTTNAATQRAWIASLAFTAGHIYKIELDIKDGTAAGQDIEGYFDDGAAQYGKIETTAAGWASVYWTFECATTTAAGKAGFRIPTSLGGNNIQVRRFSVYEITPCCTAADAVALDGWYKDTTLDIYREHWGANTVDGSFYSLKMVVASASDYVRFPGTNYDNEEWYAQFQSRTVTIGAKVNTNIADHAKLTITDSAGSTSSAYHTGGGADEWLEVTRTINAGATSVAFFIYGDIAGNVDGTTIVYVSQPMLVFGSSIGEGNYRPRQQEFIWLENRISSNLLEGETFSSSGGSMDINLEADSDAMLPKGTKVIQIFSVCNDAGSAGSGTRLITGANILVYSEYTNSLTGLANDSTNYKAGLCSCNKDGDIEWRIYASGANTFDVVNFRYIGVQVN